jgi:phage repressor protein C with HTH and peptisase S24 domain
VTFLNDTQRIDTVNTPCIDFPDTKWIMSDKAQRLREARIAAGYSSASSAAQAFGWGDAGYRHHENGTRDYDADAARRYARAFKVKPGYLLGLDARLADDTPIELGPRLSVQGAVEAGMWREAWQWPADEWESFMGMPGLAWPAQDRYGLRVEGESMNLIYPPGSVVECVKYRHDFVITSGRRVIVQRERIDGELETTVKELVRGEDGIEWLVPRSTNPAFQPFRGDQQDEDIVRCEIIALVIASIRPE